MPVSQMKIRKACKKINSLIQELTQCLNGKAPILSRIGPIVKERNGEVKKLMVLDTRQSGLKHCYDKHQRVLCHDSSMP